VLPGCSTLNLHLTRKRAPSWPPLRLEDRDCNRGKRIRTAREFIRVSLSRETRNLRAFERGFRRRLAPDHPRSKSSLIRVGSSDKKIRAPRVEEIALYRSGQSSRFFTKGIRAMTADEVLDALSRYPRDSMDSDRQTATKLGIRPPTLEDWLSGRTRPQKVAWWQSASRDKLSLLFVESDRGYSLDCC
jgi:hypothetical protein